MISRLQILQLSSGGDNFDPEVAVRVRRGPLRSSCSGPAGTTAISRSQLRSGRGHFDPEVAVRVRRGPLRSSACSYQLRSGRDRSDLGLAAPVRRGRYIYVCVLYTYIYNMLYIYVI